MPTRDCDRWPTGPGAEPLPPNALQDPFKTLKGLSPGVDPNWPLPLDNVLSVPQIDHTQGKPQPEHEEAEEVEGAITFGFVDLFGNWGSSGDSSRGTSPAPFSRQLSPLPLHFRKCCRQRKVNSLLLQPEDPRDAAKRSDNRLPPGHQPSEAPHQPRMEVVPFESIDWDRMEAHTRDTNGLGATIEVFQARWRRVLIELGDDSVTKGESRFGDALDEIFRNG